MSKFKKKSIVFFHPDLGIGGAERLIIDAAVALQSLGHKVTIYTSHCDPKHCFDEARDGTLEVRVRGSSIPASLLSRFTILFAILRQLVLLITITYNQELASLKPDIFIIDQLSFNIPLLRWLWPGPRVLFYCHFPDQLLVRGRQNWYKRVWRTPFDAAERWSMNGAEKVVVNSKFTGKIVKEVFPDLESGEVSVVYPCVSTRLPTKEKDVSKSESMWKNKKVILSINRFETKKDVSLAINAYASLPASTLKTARLVIAGGYDPRVPENLSYHKKLVSLAESKGLKTATFQSTISALSSAVPDEIDVLFLLSIPSSLKTSLLHAASLLVYTPSNEHFGIVPVEAMAAGLPVLASDTGGPLETVIEGETGWLLSVSETEAWTERMRLVLHPSNSASLSEMGRKGRERAETEFSQEKMRGVLDGVLDELSKQQSRGDCDQLTDALLGLGVAGLLCVMAYFFVMARVKTRNVEREKAEAEGETEEGGLLSRLGQAFGMA